MNRQVTSSLGACALALLAGCAQQPIGPTAGVTPGPGKTDAVFQADMNACKQTASTAIAGQVDAANRSAMTGVLTSAAAGVLSNGVANAATSATGDTASQAAAGGIQNSQASQGNIQAVYDTAFNNCMYARGENVPGMAPQPPQPEVAVYHPTVTRDPLVYKVQIALVKLGYLHGGADGVAGPKTAAAITQFETDKGLSVDGVSSPTLLASLRDAEASAGSATVQPASATGNGSNWVAPPPPASTTGSGWAEPPPPPSSK
jgi:hypothetical protein